MVEVVTALTSGTSTGSLRCPMLPWCATSSVGDGVLVAAVVVLVVVMVVLSTTGGSWWRST